MNKILIVGSNPSKKNLDPKVPFTGTPSNSTLIGWIEQIGIKHFTLINLVDEIKPKLTIKDVNKGALRLKNLLNNATHCTHILTLGINAGKACEIAGINHFKLPHPSGLNRKLNDKTYVNELLVKCKEFCGGTP